MLVSYQQHTSSQKTVSGWPRHIYLPFNNIRFSLQSTNSHYNEIRILFKPTWNNSNYIELYKLQLWGGFPAGKRRLYSIDENKNVYFPATVYSNNKALATTDDIPTTYPATSIIEDTNHRFITDTERYNWNNKETEEGALSKANAAYYNAKSYTDTKISQLINGAPEALDTLKELADALGDNEDAIAVITNSLANKVDKVAGKGLSTNDFTTTLKNKLDGIETGANKYVHPSSHPISMITGLQDALDEKATKSSLAGLGYDSTIQKLRYDTGANFYNVASEEWVSANFNKYTHPSYTPRASGLYKITVDGTGHISAASPVSKSDITALGIPAQDTVYTHPSTHPISMISGLQSALDSKLGTGGTAYNSTRWNGYQLRFGSGLSGASGYITFTY